MALSKTVTKKSVKYAMEKLNIITFNLVVLDGAVEVINQDFSCNYIPGDAPASKVAEIVKQMQVVIDRYKAEQVIFNAAALDTAVTSISGGLNL
jgi:hypothetical protein